MAGFDRSRFIAANANTGDGQFFTPAFGFYFCTLEGAQTGNAKQSGRFQVSFKWTIAEDDEKYPGKTFYHHVGLDGDKAEKGYEQLNRILGNLNYKNDPEIFASNPDGELETLIGSKVRMQVQDSKNPDFPWYNIRKLLESPLEGAVSSGVNTQATPEDTDLLKPEPETGDEDTIEKGDELNVTLKDGQHSVIVLQVIEATQQVIVQLQPPHNRTEVIEVNQVNGLLRKAKKVADDAAKSQAAKPKTAVTTAKPATTTVKAPVETTVVEVVETVEEIVELPEETVELKLEVGMMVEGEYKKQKIVGKIHQLDDKNNIVKIAMNRQAYPCPRETIKLII